MKYDSKMAENRVCISIQNKNKLNKQVAQQGENWTLGFEQTTIKAVNLTKIYKLTLDTNKRYNVKKSLPALDVAFSPFF